MAAHTKRTSIAIEQLEDGIDLFFKERYVSSIALFGAAEAILSTVIEQETGYNVLHGEWEKWNQIRSKLGNPHISKREIQSKYEPRVPLNSLSSLKKRRRNNQEVPSASLINQSPLYGESPGPS